jgi:hypothetical protein
VAGDLRCVIVGVVAAGEARFGVDVLLASDGLRLAVVAAVALSFGGVWIMISSLRHHSRSAIDGNKMDGPVVRRTHDVNDIR